MPHSAGDVLENRYRIVKLLGEGGFGAVYQAWDMKLNGPVAVIHPNSLRMSLSPEKEQSKNLAVAEGIVYCLAYSPDAQYLASGASDATIRLWDAITGDLVRIIAGHGDSLLSLAFSQDSTLLVSGLADKTVRIWRVSDGSLLPTLEGHPNAVRSVTFSPDGHYMVSASSNLIRFWGIAP
jgi:WD40 repeat protein